LGMIEQALNCRLTIQELQRTRPKVSLVMRNDKLLTLCGGYRFMPMPDVIQRIVQAKRSYESTV